MPSNALDAMICHQCGRETAPGRGPGSAFRVEDATCGACGALQPPDLRLDHFSRLGVDAAVRLDPAELGRRFRELSRALHPDRFAKSGPRERRLALEHTTLLNDAHRVLREPLKRAEYLLATRGIVVEEQARGDEAFLLEVMELREEIEDSLADPARSQALVERLQSDVERCLDDMERAVAGPDETDAPGRERARGALIRLKYVASALADLRSRIERNHGGRS